MIGARGSAYLQPGHFQVSVGYRWAYSHRHFVEDDEQELRAAEGSEVINDVHLLDLGIMYAVDERLTLSLNVPFIIAERSGSIRNPARMVVDRNVTHSRGLADISVMSRWWMLSPTRHTDQNISFGIGLKLPTGDPAANDTTRSLGSDGRTITTTTGPVDQSIQPGDGGFGVSLELQAFQRIGNGVIFISGAYLFNPRDTNGTLTGRARPSEAIMSVGDQYILRVGGVHAIPGIPGLAANLAGRIEGMPPRDIIGESNGFRRPGFSLSVEPGLLFSSGPSTVSFLVPVALYRTRQRSVSDHMVHGEGDAAFSDFMFLLGYTHRL